MSSSAVINSKSVDIEQKQERQDAKLDLFFGVFIDGKTDDCLKSEKTEDTFAANSCISLAGLYKYNSKQRNNNQERYYTVIDRLNNCCNIPVQSQASIEETILAADEILKKEIKLAISRVIINIQKILLGYPISDSYSIHFDIFGFDNGSIPTSLLVSMIDNSKCDMSSCSGMLYDLYEYEVLMGDDFLEPYKETNHEILIDSIHYIDCKHELEIENVEEPDYELSTKIEKNVELSSTDVEDDFQEPKILYGNVKIIELEVPVSPNGDINISYKPSFPKRTKDEWLDLLQLGLDAAGYVPAFGAVPDIINGCISICRGKWVDAAFSFAGAVPGIGDGIKGARDAKKVIKISSNSAKKVSYKNTRKLYVVNEEAIPISQARSFKPKGDPPPNSPNQVANIKEKQLEKSGKIIKLETPRYEVKINGTDGRATIMNSSIEPTNGSNRYYFIKQNEYPNPVESVAPSKSTREQFKSPEEYAQDAKEAEAMMGNPKKKVDNNNILKFEKKNTVPGNVGNKLDLEG